MGKCCSQPQSPTRNYGESKYSLIPRRFRRSEDRTKEESCEREGVEDREVVLLQVKKNGSRKSKRKSQNNYTPHEEIEVYPYSNNHRNGRPDFNEDIPENQSEAKARVMREQVLKSDMSVEVPNLARIVKIIVASAHEDMSDEHLILERTVYPELKTFCRKRSYDLHIIELNVEDEQFTYNDWVHEINTAHKESTGVGFMVFVGQNFGERVLPGKIHEKDFQMLSENLTDNQETLHDLYELDETNEVPCYVLKDRLNQTDDEMKEDWEASHLLIEEIEQNNLKDKCQQPCILNALFQVAALGHELANDVSSAILIERITNKERETLEDDNVEDNEELQMIRDAYKKSKGTTISYDEFLRKDKEQTEKFSRTVIEALKDKIQTAMGHPQANILLDENVKEVAHHVRKCQENLVDVDDSQEHVLNIRKSIGSYLKKNTKMPLVVHGSPGCGKTTIVSMVARLASDTMVEGTSLVVRFLGTTRHSSNLRFLLRSICFQLINTLGMEDTNVPEDFQSIVKLFHNLLFNATKTKRVLIILDGLDELPKADLLWLPRDLPDHVRIVLTVLTNGGCFNQLKEIVRDGNHFINIGDLEKPHAISYVTSWCRERKMQPGDQLAAQILDAVYRCPNILYLKLLLRHYFLKIPLVNAEKYTGSHVPNSLKHAIEHYFVTMETKYGKSVIGRIMGYLSAARLGLSEHELQCILSEDRKSGQKNSSTLHFPPFQLARILHDLSPCLSKVYFDGTLILTWKHIIIRYLAFDRYLSNRRDAMNSTYRTLSNYFANSRPTAASDDDPLASLRRVHDLPYYLCKTGNVERLKHLTLCNFNFLLEQLKATGVDYVIECFSAKHCPMDHDLKTLVETLKMSSEALNIDPNQLAAQLIGRLSDLTSSDDLTRLLYEARSSPLNALTPNTGCLNPPGTKLLHTSMDLYGPVDMTSDSTLGISVTKNGIALWDVRSAKIIRQTTEDQSVVRQVRFCRNNRLFVSDTGTYLQVWETSTFKKIWRLECPERIQAITLAGEANDALAATSGSTITSWNLRNGHVMSEITEEGRVFNRITGWREYVACANSTTKDVRVYDIFQSCFVTHIQAYEENTKDTVNSVFLSSFGDGQVMTNSENSFEIRVFRLSNGEWLRTIGPDIVNPRLTSDGRYILSTNSRNDISVWSMETGIKITNVFRHPPTSIITNIVANDLTKLVTLSDNKILRVWDLGKEESIQQSLSQEKDDNCIRNVMFIKSKGEQRQAVSRSKVSGDICVWNLSNCKPVRILKGTQADDVLVVDETRAVLRSMGKLALIDLEEGRLIKKLRVSFPRMASRSRLERRASSLYKRRNLSLRLLQRSGVTSKPRCTQFSDVAIVGQQYVLVLTSKRNVLKLISLEDGQLVAKLDSGHKECVETILVSADGRSLICSYDKSPAAAWDLETRRVVAWLRVENAFPKLCKAAITRDGQYLVDAVKVNDCPHIATWNVASGEVQCKIALPGATVQALAASSASGTILCSSKKEYRNTVMVYSLRSGTQLYSLPCGIRQQINNIHLSLDGQRALTFATGDRTIKLWNTAKGVQIGSFTADSTISDCALSDDGNNVVIAIYKASTIASLTLASQRQSKEMSVDLANPYYNPENYGAVFEFRNILDWDDDTGHMDNTLAEKQ